MRNIVEAGRRRRALNVKGGRSRRVYVRVSAEEYESLKILADSYEMSIPRFVLWATLGGNTKRETQVLSADLVKAKRELAVALMQVKYQIGQIGNNINQIAKVLNSDGLLPDERVWRSALVRLHKVWWRLGELLDEDFD